MTSDYFIFSLETFLNVIFSYTCTFLVNLNHNSLQQLAYCADFALNNEFWYQVLQAAVISIVMQSVVCYPSNSSLGVYWTCVDVLIYRALFFLTCSCKEQKEQT